MKLNLSYKLILAILLPIVGIPLMLFYLSNQTDKEQSLSLSAPSFERTAQGFVAKNLLFEATLPRSSDLAVRIGNNKKAMEITPINSSAAGAKIDGNKILYPNAYPSSTIEYVTTAKGLKESIVLHSKDNLPKEFSYNFNADDLRAELQKDNSIVFTQVSKEPARDISVSDGTILPKEKAANFLPEHPKRFIIPSPFMIDARGRKSAPEDMEVLLDDGKLILRPNLDWLKNASFPVIVDPTVEVAPQIVEEIADKRALTSKTFLNDDGSYTSVIYQNPIHYKEAQGKFEDIDRQFQNSSDKDFAYDLKTGIYTAKLKESLADSQNQGDIELDFGGAGVGFSPLEIGWDSGDILGNVKKTKGEISQDKTSVTYPSLFGVNGIDLQGTYDNEKFLKETVIKNPDAIDLTKHKNENLEIKFTLSLSSGVDLKVNGKVWDKNSSKETQDAIGILQNGEQISQFSQATVYDSGQNVQPITIRLAKEENQLTLTKIMPASFLSTAVYPVRTDTTDTFYSNNDGAVRSAHATYATARSGGTLTTDTRILAGQENPDWTGSDYWNRESFVQFDTSSIPDTDTISAAVFSLYGKSGGPPLNGSDVARVRLRDYGATLDTGDWVAGASVSSLTLVAHSSSWSTSSYNDFTDDAMPANVSKTGSTRLIIHTKFHEDGTNSPSGIYAESSTATGTTTDPKLTVTHAAPTTAPTITSPTQTGIQGSQATLGGNVTSDGGATITGRGVCVGTSANPALGGNCFSTSGTTGVFTVLATSLTQNTLYHYRAYATNSVGTSYTTDDTFTTLALDNYLVTVVTPQTAGACVTGTNTVTARDSTNTTITTDTSTVDMTNSGTGVTFYTTSGCSSSTTQYTLSSGVSNIYYKTNKAQSFTITATKNGSSETGTSSSITVNANSQTRLVITLPSQTFTDGSGNSGSVTNQIAGVQFTITKISATDDYFNVITSYSGAKTLAYSGPSSSMGAPSYTTSVSFTNGQSTTTLSTTLYAPETTTITVTDGGSYGYASSSLTINPRGINIRGKVEFRGKVDFQP